MKITAKIYLFVFYVLISSSVFAQKKPVLTDEEQVIEMVTTEMDGTFKEDDFLKKKNKKFKDVSGTMVVDISVIQNGKVSTFFKVDSEIKNIDFINFMSEYILNHKFKFKLQKQQRYKIRYTATF
jgi:hypothetical protein